MGGAAVVSIVLALGSFALTCTGNPIWGLIAGVLALPSGGIGFLAAASPRRRGGLISIAAVVLGLIAVVVAILGLMGVIAGAVV